MSIMSIFQTNWLDFLMWTLAGCMGIAFVVHLIELIMPSGLLEKSKEISKWPNQLRKAS